MCSFATDTQRFHTAPHPVAVYELWHKTTTAGSAVSKGFVARGNGDAMIDEARRRMRTASHDDAQVDYYLVEAGSYAGFPEPNLGPGSRIAPGPLVTDWKPAFFVRPDGRRVEVSGLSSEDSEGYVLTVARQNARADEKLVEIEYTDGSRRSFRVCAEDRS